MKNQETTSVQKKKKIRRLTLSRGPDPKFKSLKDIFNLLSNRPLYTKKQQNTQLS